MTSPDLLPDYMRRIARLERLAHQLDSAFRIPGTKIRFGWDPILGILPGIGDLASAGPGAYILLESHRMGVPTHVLGRQLFNIGVDTVVGSIPVIGTFFDVGLRANRRNVKMLREYIETREGVVSTEDAPTGLK